VDKRPDRATVREAGELGVIEAARRHGGGGGRIVAGIGDDAAVLAVPRGQRLLASCDMLVEGIHFRRDWAGPDQVGEKAAAVNLSDIAAMGGRPIALLTSLALPPGLPMAWVEAFYDGFERLANRWGSPLVGGDTVGSPGPVVVDVTVLGVARKPVPRTGAAAGDVLVLTGPVGAAAAGLALLERGVRWPGGGAGERRLLEAQLTPRPRVDEGRWLAEVARAMTDLSDGLGVGLVNLLGGLGATLDASQVPRLPEVSEVAGRLGMPETQLILNGGEDYELLAAVPSEAWPALADTFRRRRRPLHRIGVVHAGPELVWRELGREVTLRVRPFDHFGVGHDDSGS
jgi:thiamine-monophosphate kinase